MVGDKAVAIARCEQCGVPAGRFQNYSTKKYFPLGYPQSDLICGSSRCRNHAVVWLTFYDEEMYRNGERIFSMDTTTKIKLE